MVHGITRGHQLDNERRVGEKRFEATDVYLIRRKTAPTRRDGVDAIPRKSRINFALTWNYGRADKIIIWPRPAITAPVAPIRCGSRPGYTERTVGQRIQTASGGCGTNHLG